MADSLELANLFSHTNIVDEASYEKVEYTQLYDVQNGSYASGQITFNTDSQMKNHIVYSDSYLQLPIQVQLATDARVAVKASILSFIQGVQIESSQGTQICNDQVSTPIINNLKLLLDSSIDFVSGNELHFFGKDKALESDVAGTTNTVYSAASPTVSVGAGSSDDRINAFRNPTLANRISVFERQATYAAASGGALASRTFVAYIPLRYIHDFFSQMDFPMVNLSLRITFNIAGVGSYAQWSPWTTPTFPQHMSLASSAQMAGAAAAATPLILAAVPAAVVSSTVIVSSFKDKMGAMFSPRLFLKTVYFRAAEAQALKDEIVKGFTKTIVYRNTNWYTKTMDATGTVNWPFAMGIIRPTRMFVFCLPANTLGKTDNCFPASVGVNCLTNTQVLLNGNTFYNHQFVSQYDHYREFKTQLIGASSSTASATPISYSDFISGLNPYVFDLSRNVTVKTNNLCTLTLITTVFDQAATALAGGVITPPSVACDMWVLVERLQTCTLKVSEGGVEVLTRQGADL